MNIAISGKQGSGKDFVADVLAEKLGLSNTKLAMAVKEKFSEITGIPLSEVEQLKNTNPLARSFIIYISEREKLDNPYYWVDRIIDKDNIVISDFRFKVEAERFKEKDYILIRINCPREIRATRRTLSNEDHYSETDLDGYNKFDYIIDNIGTKEEIERKIGFIMLEILGITKK